MVEGMQGPGSHFSTSHLAGPRKLQHLPIQPYGKILGCNHSFTGLDPSDAASERRTGGLNTECVALVRRPQTRLPVDPGTLPKNSHQSLTTCHCGRSHGCNRRWKMTAADANWGIRAPCIARTISPIRPSLKDTSVRSPSSVGPVRQSSSHVPRRRQHAVAVADRPCTM